ncbi:MAG: hypothetical protein ACKOW8_04900 [Flavobacteriales bacterium]
MLAGVSCRRDNGQVPLVPVNIQININQPDFFNLSVISGWIYITGGSRGIIVYRKAQDEFIALERHSAFNPAEGCAVTVNSDGVIISDPCSDSQWLITDGSVLKGPAAAPLQVYKTDFQNPFLNITN